jgi:hypothetical protein
MEKRWGDQPECSEALAEAAAAWLRANPTPSFEDCDMDLGAGPTAWLRANPTPSFKDCATHFNVDPQELAEALHKKAAAVSEAAAAWLRVNPTSSFEDCATHFNVDPWHLYYVFLRNETILDHFAAATPDPPPPCPRCGGKSIRITYGYSFPLPLWFCFKYAGPTLYAYFAPYVHFGCCPSSEKFYCKQCDEPFR